MGWIYSMTESKRKISKTLGGRKNPWVTQHLKGKNNPKVQEIKKQSPQR
jgi:hypothetical protein